MWYLRVVLLCIYGMLHAATAQNIVLGITLPFNVDNTSTTPTGELYAQAAYLAVDAVNKDSTFLAGRTLKVVLNKSDCHTNEKTLQSFTYQWKTADVHGFIGTGCSCDITAKLAGIFNLPLMSQVSYINIVMKHYPKFVQFSNGK